MASYRDTKNRLVVLACTEGGLGSLDRGRWSFVDTRQGFPSKIIKSVLPVEQEDGTLHLWAGTFGGLVRLTPSKWTAYTTQSGLSENVVFSIEQTRDGGYWFGTLGGGLARFSQGKWTNEDQILGHPAKAILDLYKTKEGND